MDPGLTIACTLTAAAAAVYAGLICVKKCPPRQSVSSDAQKSKAAARKTIKF